MQPIPFGRYLLLERLALGGTAEIFKAKLLGIEGFEKIVVIKCILPHWSANSNFISMLIDEAKIMVRLSHERIVQVYELGREGENYYIAMEYIAGTDLRRLSDALKRNQKKLKTEEVIYIVCEILRGLEYIHKQTDERGNKMQIVHRDISPQNILISTEGAIKIADFGIAHAASRSYETVTGVLKGKFAYMSPEQARGSSLDARTDIFATGILLFELLTQKRLFSGGSDLTILERVKNFSLDEIDSEIPALFKPILSKALAPDLKNRYATAQEFLEDLIKLQKSSHLFTEPNLLGNKVSKTLKNDPISPNPNPLETAALGAPANTFAFSASDTFLLNTPAGNLEDTRSLSNFSLESSPSLHKFYAPTKKSRKKLVFILSICLFILVGLFIFYQNYRTSKQASQSSSPRILETQPVLNSLPSSAFPEAPSVEKTPLENKPTLPPKPDLVAKGLLSVRASPWGKISVSGYVSGSEKPFSRQVAYGNYQIQVTYKGLGGSKVLSKSVRVAKPSTFCSAIFHPDGTGALTCR